jgi:ABC-type microcin C transport system duplicated ATPase subunit YejF
MIFQEPMTALDPVYTVGQQIGEMVRRHTGVRPQGGAGAGARTARSGRHPVGGAAARRLSA